MVEYIKKEKADNSSCGCVGCVLNKSDAVRATRVHAILAGNIGHKKRTSRVLASQKISDVACSRNLVIKRRETCSDIYTFLRKTNVLERVIVVCICEPGYDAADGIRILRLNIIQHVRQ